MKKRVKLFTTIASLCLAVALMAFGVYAATNQNVSVTNTVTFTATKNVEATVAFTKATALSDCAIANAAEGETLTFTRTENTTTKTHAIGTKEDNVEQPIAITVAEGIAGDSTNVGYSYTVTITNTYTAAEADGKLYATFTGLSTDSAYTFTITYGTNQTVVAEDPVEIGAGNASVVFTVRVQVNNTALSIESKNMGYSIALSQGV